MKIYIEDMQNKIIVTNETTELINRVVEKCLESETFEEPIDLTILLVDNEEIAQINKEQRNIDKPTDVLSFPMLEMKNGVILKDEGDFNLDEGTMLLGDIVVSLEKTMEQSIEYEHSFERELAFLITHGFLHLLGYDHENDEDEKLMFEKQEKILYKMNLCRD